MAQPPKFEAEASNDTHQDSPLPPTSEPARASSGEQADPADAGSAGPENDPDIETFEQMGVPPPLLDAVSAMGWERPTKVQTSTFDPVSQGRDVIVQSQTGSGKTGAFCLPWLAARFEDAPASQTGVQLLVLTPTRELAKQVCGQLVELGKDTNVTPLPVYGGTAMQPQLQALKEGVHAVVGTPGRILDHIRRRTLKLNAVQMVVLDEADEMLSMGFLEDIHAILDACPKERQTTLFSATVPPDIERIARRYMQDPVTIKLSGDQVAAAEIGHAYYTVSGTLRTRDLVDVIALEEPPTGLIFCNTREETNFVASVLRREGFSAEALSSDLTQVARERVLGWMRSGKLRFLVATDVASRGIDISHISHVINYTFPQNAESYVHRTGRTGRAGRAGQALSLISAQELGNFYYLKLQYPSIEFEERKLPPGSELEAQRIENKLDLISARFPELVSPEWALLARHLVKDPRGEQVVAYLLSEAMSRTEEPKEEADEELREAREMRRGRRDRDSERHRDRDRDGDHRRRDRDDDRPRGRGRTRDRRRRDSDDGRVRADRATEEDREERTDADAAERLEPTSSSEPAQQADAEAKSARRERRRARRDDREEADRDQVDRDQVDRDQGADTDGIQAGSAAVEEPSAATDGEPSATAAAATDDAAADGDSGRRRRRRRRRGRGKDRGPRQDEAGTETKDAQSRDEVSDQPAVAAPLPTPLPTEPAGASEAAQSDDETVELPAEGADLIVDETRTEPLETADAGDTADGPRKRRRRRRRRRGGKTDGEAQPDKRAAAANDKGEDQESSDSSEGEGGKKRRRRRRKSRRKGSSEQAAQPPHVSQDQIIIDIDEEELEVVRDQFGEIDELDDLTLKGRRRGVMDALQDEVELEDMSKRDVSSEDDSGDEESSDDDSSDDAEETASESDEDEANEQAADAPTDDRELKKKKRRRRRRKKKPEEAPAPELTAPPHKDFWEVWASKFSFRDFGDDKYADEPVDDTPSDDVLEAVAAQALSAAQFENDEDDASFVTVLLSVGRQHGKKSAHIRELLANDFQLTGKAVRDLTVTDGHTKFRISEASYERLSQGMPGYVFDGVELELTLVEPAPGEATSQDNEVEGGPSPASNEDAGSPESVQPT